MTFLKKLWTPDTGPPFMSADEMNRIEEGIADANQGAIMDTQLLEGANDGYQSFVGGAQVNILADTVNLLQLQYTPPVDAWWEVSLQVGLVQKVDAAYHQAYAGVLVTPAPASGSGQAWGARLTQHSTVDTYAFRAVSKLFRLAAGVTYTAQGAWSADGGTWQYFQGAGYLWIQGRAWPR